MIHNDDEKVQKNIDEMTANAKTHSTDFIETCRNCEVNGSTKRVCF